MADTLQPKSPLPVEIPPFAETGAIPPNTASSAAELRTQSEMREIEKEIVEEWRWILDARERGDFDPYRGQHVAVMNGKILGSGYDPQLLRELLALKHNLDPERIVTVCVGNW